MTEPVGEMDLLAYVDALLDPARRAEVERHLAEAPRDASRVAADLAINQGIRCLYAAPYAETPPERLSALLKGPRRSSRPVVWAAAAALLLVVGAAGGWWSAGELAAEPAIELLAAGPLPDGSASLVTARAGANPAARLVDGFKQDLRPPDLRLEGFELMGETVLARLGRPVLRLTYGDREGRHLDLFLQSRWDKDVPSRLRDADGRPLVAWAHGPAVFALTGSLEAEDLQVIAEEIQHQAAVPEPAPVEARLKPVADPDGR